MTSAIIAIVASLFAGVAWWVTNRLPTKQEIKHKQIDEEKGKVDQQIDTWANH